MPNPTISVVIPVFNGEQWLREAIDSALNQTYPPLEIIVVDDGSADGSPEIASSYPPPVRVVRQENAGAAVTRNRGVEGSRGRLIAFLDADDWWEPTKLDRHAEVHSRDDSVGLSFSAKVLEFSDGRRVREDLPADMSHFVESDHFSGRHCVVPSVAVGQRDLILQMGGFDSRMFPCEDQDLFLRMMLAAKWAPIREPVTIMRRGHVSATTNLRRLLASNRELYRKHRHAFGHGVRNEVIWHRAVATHLLDMGFAELAQGNATRALWLASRSITTWPVHRTVDRARLIANAILGAQTAGWVARQLRRVRGNTASEMEESR